MIDVKTIRARAVAAREDSLIMPYLQFMLIDACDEIENLRKTVWEQKERLRNIGNDYWELISLIQKAAP